MKINVLKVCADGTLEKLWIQPSVLDIRLELSAPIDNINLFTDVQSFICRQPNQLSENILLPGVYGDVIFTGGRGSYLAGLSLEQMSRLSKLFRGEKKKLGKTRL